MENGFSMEKGRVYIKWRKRMDWDVRRRIKKWKRLKKGNKWINFMEG